MGPACSIRLPKIHLINPWLLGEECKPIIIRDADGARHPDRNPDHNPDHKKSGLKPWLYAVGVKPFI